MFDHTGSVIGLWPGERPEDSGDDLAFELTCRELADGGVNPERDLLPNDLEDLLPGPYLATIVSAVDPGRLNGHDAVRLMRARARLSSHNEAGKLRAMAEVAFSPPGDADSPVERDLTEIEYVAAEIAAGLALTRRSSETELSRALSFNGRLRRVWSALSAGAIDLAKAKVFDQALGHLPDDTVNTVLDQIIAESGELTIGQLRARLSRLVLAADPDGSASAFQEGLSDRGVATYANPDQTGSFLIHNSNPTDIAAARSHVEEIARSLKTADESRTLEEIRADVALDLLQGKCLHKREARSAGRTNLQVSAETLLGWSDAPGGPGGIWPRLGRDRPEDRTRERRWGVVVRRHGQWPTGCDRNPEQAARRLATATSRGDVSNLCLPGLSSTFVRLRSRSSQAFLSGRTDSQRQPWPTLPSSSHGSPPRSVATPPTSRR